MRWVRYVVCLRAKERKISTETHSQQTRPERSALFQFMLHFYLHARIWYPIVNNKVISLFFDAEPFFSPVLLIFHLHLLFNVRQVKCKHLLHAVLMFCFFFIIVRCYVVSIANVLLFFPSIWFAVSGMGQYMNKKKSGNKCARPCNVGFYFMPILCGGVKSLFGFVFTVVWPSDSVAPLICCDIMPSLFVSRNTVCFESWHQITTAAILVANGKLA